MNEPKTLYAITSHLSYGEDYHICAITSNPDRAEQILKECIEYETRLHSYYTVDLEVKIEKFIDGIIDLGYYDEEN